MIDTSAWEIDLDTPTMPGTHPKTLLVCPDGLPPPLKAHHRYLLKQPNRRAREQIWSEVLAREVGQLANVEVPFCCIARGRDGKLGVLIELFTFEKNLPARRLEHGADLLIGLYSDHNRLRPHSLRSNIELAQTVGVADAVLWWAKTIAFDALIGNTDRHPGNWGILSELTAPEGLYFRLAPAFDNGTSFGYEMADDKAAQMVAIPGAVARYVERGRHDCSWDAAPDKPTNHFELCQKIITEFRGTSAAMRDVIRFEMRDVAAAISALRKEGLSEARARLMLALLAERRRRLSDLLRDVA